MISWLSTCISSRSAAASAARISGWMSSSMAMRPGAAGPARVDDRQGVGLRFDVDLQVQRPPAADRLRLQHLQKGCGRRENTIIGSEQGASSAIGGSQ